MDFDLSEDQEALRDAAGELLDGLASPPAVRKVVDAGGGYDAALWQAMVDQGWVGVAVPEDAGGLGLGTVEVVVLLEQLGRRAAPAPFAATVLALEALRAGGADDLAGALLAGDAIGCVAWSRSADAVLATKAGGGWSLRGRPDPVPYAPSSAVAVVAAHDGEGPALFAVEVDESSRPQREPAMDRTRELGWFTFDGTAARVRSTGYTVPSLNSASPWLAFCRRLAISYPYRSSSVRSSTASSTNATSPALRSFWNLR